VVDLAREGFGVNKSSVSRSFVAASAAEVRQLSERRFDGIRFPAIYIDGVQYAGETMVVVLGVLENGAKRVGGRNALIQRRQAHKKRNVREHLPQKHWPELSRQLSAAY
jgi:transposase-like protein